MSNNQFLDITYSPYTNCFYQGALDKGRDDQWDADFGRDKNYAKIAKLNLKRERGDGQLEFKDAGVEIRRQAERDYRQGATDSTSLGYITVIELLREVIGREWREFNAINAVRRIPVPKLQLNVPIVGKYTANDKVPELVVPDQKTNTFTQAQLRLFKNVVDLYQSDEARLKGTIEPLNFEIDQAAGALGQVANTQIATEIETATTLAAGGPWNQVSVTHGRNNNNPLTDLISAATTITGLNYRPDTLCMHPNVAGGLLTNSFINGQMPPGQMVPWGVFQVPNYPGVKAVVDQSFTGTTATFLDSRTMLLGEGPTVAEQYRDPYRGADGWVIRQWMHPLLSTANASRKITGAYA